MAFRLEEATQSSSDSVCMLFTDIEGSTNLVDSYPDVYDHMLLRHNELLRNAIQSYGGEEINVVGDSVFALFPASTPAVQAAIDAQFALTPRGVDSRLQAIGPDGAARRISEEA